MSAASLDHRTRIEFDAPEDTGFQSPVVDPACLTGCYVIQYLPGHAGDVGYIERRGRIAEHPVMVERPDGSLEPDHTMFRIGWFHWPLVEGRPPITSESAPDSTELVCRDQMTAGWSFTMDFDFWNVACAAALITSARRECVARLSDWRAFCWFGSERTH